MQALLSFKLLLAVATVIGSSAAHEGHEEASTSGSTSVETVGGECDTTTTADVLAKVDNATYFTSCAEDSGEPLNMTNMFDALDLSTADFLRFCNSSTCLEPVHALLHKIPTNCLIDYGGSARNLSAEVTALHDDCHELLESVEEGSSSSSGAVSTPEPTTDAASSVSPGLVAIVVAATSVLAMIA